MRLKFALAALIVILAGTVGNGGALAAPFEPNVDRMGGDYTRFSVAEPNQCRAACEQNFEQCLAWTWVKPGIQGPQAQCWLKNKIPPARASDCCVSGVNRPSMEINKHF